MLNSIVFYELRHYGDMHITRNFVKYVMANIPARKYIYVLEWDKKVFKDIPNLFFEKYKYYRHPFVLYDEWKLIDNTLFINTSCGAGNMFLFNGTTIQTAYSIFDHYLKSLCNHTMPLDLSSFIPSINFNSFNITNVKAFMHQYKGITKVLFVNGKTQSGQTANFDMYPLIQIIAKEYPNHMFFVTNPIENVLYHLGKSGYKIGDPKIYNPGSNIFLCKDILKIPEPEPDAEPINDIVETTYFGTFCDLIIGRASGVYTLSINKSNTIDNPKKFVCLSHTERDKDLGVSSILPAVAENFVWTNNFNYTNMLSVIRGQLNDSV